MSGVVVDGQPVAASPGGRVDVPGIGDLVFIEQARRRRRAASTSTACASRSPIPQAAQTIGEPFVIGHLELTRPPRARRPVTTAPRATTARARGRPPGHDRDRPERHGADARRPLPSHAPAPLGPAAPGRARREHRERPALRVPGRRSRELLGRLRGRARRHRVAPRQRHLRRPRHAGRRGRRRPALAGGRQHPRAATACGSPTTPATPSTTRTCRHTRRPRSRARASPAAR